jgi:hypothetical protein
MNRSLLFGLALISAMVPRPTVALAQTRIITGTAVDSLTSERLTSGQVTL